IYSTYLGGTGQDNGEGIAVDTVGSVHVFGRTNSADFPVLAPLQGPRTSPDAFVTKLAPGGSALVYSTHLGGDGDENGGGIAIDGAGVAYVAGFTSSTNFPTFLAFQPTHHGGFYDAFVAKISPVTPSRIPSGNRITAAALALILLIVSIQFLWRRRPDRA